MIFATICTKYNRRVGNLLVVVEVSVLWVYINIYEVEVALSKRDAEVWSDWRLFLRYHHVCISNDAANTSCDSLDTTIPL